MQAARSSKALRAGKKVQPSHCAGAQGAAGRRYGSVLGILLAIALIIGCARQYHWYRCGCGCVDYRYCPPAPLPFTSYCNCSTPIADSYFAERAQQGGEQSAPEEPFEPFRVPGK